MGALKLQYKNQTNLRVVYKATENYRKKTTLQENGTTVNTRIFAGNYEKETLQDGTIKEYHYISGPTGLIAIYIITNGTGHEMLQHFALINMNGRMYSLSRTRFGNPVLGRMLSPDNYVQDPSNAQNYNRYAYVLNNPLKYVDPSGESFIGTLVGIGVGAIVGMFLPPLAPIAATIAAGGYDLLTNNWQGWEGSGKPAVQVGIGVASGFLGNYVNSTSIPFSYTVSIIESSTLYSAVNNIISGGESDLVVSYGAGSYNFTTNKGSGIWDWNELSGWGKFGYASGAFANVSDIWAYAYNAYGDNVDLVSNSHSEVHYTDKNGIKQKISGGTYELEHDWRNVFKPGEGTTDYYSEPGIFYRKQIIRNVNIDKLSAYHSYINNNGFTYRFGTIFPNMQNSMHCAILASRALLHSGVFNVPILRLPGLLSAQMYIREFSYYSYYFQNH